MSLAIVAILAHGIARLVVEIVEAAKSRELLKYWLEHHYNTDDKLFWAYDLGSIITLGTLWLFVVFAMIQVASKSKTAVPQVQPDKPSNSTPETPPVIPQTYSIALAPAQYAPPSDPPPYMEQPVQQH
jgi:hypothetical protein